ncbi:BUG/TctC family periplasmic protein [Cupriavidus sp. U2]|nr:BUG/TctC family periplasmic protein [Cupriavidus sp. U2]
MTRLPSRIAHAVVACTLAAGASLAFADTFPSKPIQLVIPFPPGGATEVIGRLVGKKLGDKLGQTVVIDNRPGAGTIVGASYVAKAAPDGYTLLASSGTTFTVNPAIQPSCRTTP